MVGTLTSLKGCTLHLVIQHCTLAVLANVATDLLSMYMYIVPI